MATASSPRESIYSLNTRRIVTAGILGAIAIVLGVTQLGAIPVPNISGRATIMHIPTIIGACLEGPVVGVLVGLIFGIFSIINDTTGLFKDPLIAVFPRLMIGITSYYTYRALLPTNRDLAAAAAGVIGTLTNTVLVLGLLVGLNRIPAAAVPGIIPQAVAELVIAAIINVIVVRAVTTMRSGSTTATDKGPRDKSFF